MGRNRKTSDPQFEFILDVIQAIEDSNGDAQVVYPLLAANIDKLNEKLAEKLQDWARINLAKKEAKVKFIADFIGNFSNRIREFTLGEKVSNIEIAITGYEVVLTVYTREAFPIEWAITQNNLGIAYAYRIKGEKAQNIENSIACYKEALRVYTFEAFPIEWATTQNNLGHDYYDRIKGEKAQNIENSIACYQQALRVYTFEEFPIEWARTQNNLGHDYYDRIKGEKAQNIENSIACYKEALRVYTFEEFPIEWATTQNNLGIAYSYRIKGEKAQNIENSIACYQQAFTVRTFEGFPIEWAETQNNLGIAYYYRIKGEKAQNIEEAIACYQQAIIVLNFEEFPIEWATTQNNLGNAYGDRIKGEKAQNIEEAIACLKQALTVTTFEGFPIEWAQTQNNLGNAYGDRIEGEKPQNIEEAIACYQQALRVRTFEAFPIEWAETQNNLGIAYSDRIKGEKAQNIEEAIACYQEALRVRTFEEFSIDWARTQNNLGGAYSYRIKGEKAQNSEDAIACFQQALRVRTFEAFPQSHAETLFNLGLTYQDISQFTSAYSTFASAIATVESLREEIVSGDESKRKQAEEWNKLYISMVEVCLELTNITEAIEYVERSKTRNLVEQILSRDLKTIFPADVVTQLEQYRDEIAIGQYKIQHGKAENPTALAQHLQELRQQRNELQNRYLPIGSSFQFKQFQQKLDDRTTIVEFYITRDKLLTFIFTNQTQQPIVWESQPKDLDQLVNWANGYWRAYSTKKFHWQRRLTTRLHLLAQILHIDDIIQQIPPECDRLILIPHRYLHLFPLHALPINSQQVEATSKILMDQFPAGVSYAPSCQLLQLTQSRKRPEDFTHLFAVQNPTDDLVYTNLEVEVIKSFFKAAEVLASQEAKEAAVKVNENLTTAHCCHFSCHGSFNLESPLESALVLAETKTEQIVQDQTTEDGFLTLEEIFGLKLEQCRLVTLSACETGLIDFNNTSDEYIGLPSGFLVAGSPAVVSSLWTVNDLSTALLIIKFYDNLLNYQMSLAVALNQAQFWLRDTTKEKLEEYIDNLPLTFVQKYLSKAKFHNFDDSDKPFEAPFYWAAFCAIGQ
ncbi:MAG: CHAT domain-containing protein [Moorea sp. SIOASIH]|uniref:CHAT domain-containing protein n=1 Tax=Moorena sp. SIOASIH TaxID=2607817 RepID=UPI0013BCCFD4|nr:CHAT domain-containing protein [Moorena sp. SIOASIH]NEO41263.1 CHAT domain-containing protein [Moorena sp. SIOASIH]